MNNIQSVGIWIPSPGIGDFIVRIPAIKLINKYFFIVLIVAFPKEMDMFLKYLLPNFSGKIIYDGYKYSKTRSDLIFKNFLDILSVFNRPKINLILILVDDNSFFGYIKYVIICIIRFYNSNCYIIKSNSSFKFPFLTNIEIDGVNFKIERYFKFAQRFLKIIGINNNQKYHDFIFNKTKHLHNEKIIIAPGGKYEHQIWPYYQYLNMQLLSLGFDVVLIGSSDENTLLNSISNRNQTILLNSPLITICKLLEESKLVICNDSGILHLAAYIGSKTICICGHGADKAWVGYSFSHIITLNSISENSTVNKYSKENHINSLKLISPDQVIKIILSIFKNK